MQIKKIWSKVEPENLLHQFFSSLHESDRRTDLCADEEYLQVACIAANKGTTCRPHRHITLTRETDITQEVWIVVSGCARVTYYDLDGSVLRVQPLFAGSCSITFRGGHSYEILNDDTVIFEVKSGPYFGQVKDKVFLGGGFWKNPTEPEAKDFNTRNV